MGWYSHLFSRKKELLMLGVALIVISFISKWIAVEHWASLNWEVTGYHPVAPFMVFAWALITMAILYLRRIRSIGLWGMALIAFGYGMIMFWMLYLN